MKQVYFLLTFLFFFSFFQAQIVDIPDANFKDALINTNCVDTDGDDIYDSDADLNDDGEIQVSEAEAVLRLDLHDLNISSLQGIETFSNLLVLNCRQNLITTIDVSSLINLKDFNCALNQLVSLDVSSLSNLETLDCSSNQLATLNINGLINLESLRCNANNLIELDASGLTSLGYLNCPINNLNTLDVSGNINLTYLNCSYNQLESFDASGLTSLTDLSCNNNQLAAIDLSGLINLVYFYCYNNSLTVIDGSDLMNLTSMNCSNNQLVSLFIKNGKTNSVSFNNNPNLEFICVDNSEWDNVQIVANQNGNTNCVVSSYCSFTPGGTFYSVYGETKLDINIDGCNTGDLLFPGVKFNVSNGITNGYFFSNDSGQYNIDLQADEYTIIPLFEDLTYYNVLPTSLSVMFPDDTSPFNQDFCITANGEINDLEIVIIPLEATRPGINVDYKIIYKNKGTTTQSGTVFFDFSENSGQMEFVSSNPVNDTLENDMLTWSYTNLQPFETREILVTLNMNTPMETPPLNTGDDIGYVADIHPYLEDETPGNNNFQIKLTVVNSIDPNDITCLEGETIAPEKVGDYVHYLIRFENTGTAEALNIVVKDEIDLSKFDISTLVPLDGSHDYFTRIRDNNVVEFIFEDINLPFDDANNDGYVLFKIKTLETLQLGDVFTSEANIYFDYNFPILTNTASTEVAELLSVSSFENGTVKVYPNPTNNTLTINTTELINNVNITDINGRIVLNQIGNTQSSLRLDLSSLSKGIYFVNVHTSSDNQIIKIVKQ